jgi:uncharacterized repeat protein (TIGR03803 family)
MSRLELPKMIFKISFFCIVSALASVGQTFTTLINFDYTNGSGPDAALVQGTDGNLYGTTGLGGTDQNCSNFNGCGTVFKTTPSGTITTLHSFDITDGSYPTGLTQGRDGNFYGTTAYGGSSNNCTNGCGTVFKITPSGTLTTLHSFEGSDGSGPYSGLIQGSDGSFYGTTAYGGASSTCTNGCGTVFKITAGGALTTLHSFDGMDGSGPNAGVVQGTDGNFYGTTYSGGTYGAGTVFKMNARGTVTPLHSFGGPPPASAGPYSGLIQGADGDFYGTTEVGGTNTNGTVFKITATGSLTTLHAFDYQDGDFPAGVVQGTDGNLYGTTQGGGLYFFGTVFQLNAKGVLTTLHNFDASDGEDPQSAPVQATNGTFYGTTFTGGQYGTMFSLSVGLGSFVATNPTSGKVGTHVTILGNNLASATSVTFNGTKATFKASGTYITTTVPTGATTGSVEVATPKKTLKSDVPFRVP